MILENQPLISIITISLNSEKYIRQTLESVLNQSYTNIEYIIVDGLSKDNTINIIKEYEPLFNNRLKWISEKDYGIYDAMNKGISMANGELIGIINSDDWYDINALKSIVDAYLESPSLDIFYGDTNTIDEISNTVLLKPIPQDIKKYALSSGMPICHQSIFVKNQIYKKLGLFNSTYKIAGDHEFIVRCIKNNVGFKYVNHIVANYRLGGVSDNNFIFSLKESTRTKILYGCHPIKAWYEFLTSGMIKAYIYKKCKDNKIFKMFLKVYRKYKYRRIK